MKRILAVLVPLLLTTAMLAKQRPGHQKDPNLLPIDWLTGGTWTGSVTGPDGSITRIESRVRWAPTGTAIYFDTFFNQKAQYHGMYAYDASRAEIRFFYSSADGQIAEGSSLPGADGLQQSFTVKDAKGVAEYTSTLARSGPDSYEFNVYHHSSGVPIVTVSYQRR